MQSFARGRNSEGGRAGRAGTLRVGLFCPPIVRPLLTWHVIYYANKHRSSFFLPSFHPCIQRTRLHSLCQVPSFVSGLSSSLIFPHPRPRYNDGRKKGRRNSDVYWRNRLHARLKADGRSAGKRAPALPPSLHLSPSI